MSELGLPEHHAHSAGGLDIKGAFTKKIGPMPGYAWLGLILVLAYGYHWYTGRSIGSTIVDTPGDTGVADTSGAAAGVGGGVAYTGTDTSGTSTGLGGGQVTTGPAATYTAANPPSGTKFIRNLANGQITEVWPDGTELVITSVEYAALGRPKTSDFGAKPAAKAAIKYTVMKPPAGTRYATKYPGAYTVQVWPDASQHYVNAVQWNMLGRPARTFTIGTPPKPAVKKAVAKPAAKDAAKAAAKAAAKPAPRTYVVKSGDSLFSIAQHFYGNGNKYSKIASANHIANPNLIHAGTRLVIPT